MPINPYLNIDALTQGNYKSYPIVPLNNLKLLKLLY
jgi:hypothetical protein